jgi:phosphoadenosine phosphosulfate reductase
MERAAALTGLASEASPPAGRLTDTEIERLDQRFEKEPADAILDWAVQTFHPRLCLAASMTDAVLIDMAVRAEPSIEVVFIDTGYHFEETMDMVELVRRHYDLNLRVMGPPPQPAQFWMLGERCCSDFKVAQLDRALEGKDAWVSGLRRVEALTRATASIVGRDRRGLVKVNPLARWSDEQVARYIQDNEVPVNPLVGQGFPSIGCWPCTRPVTEGEHARAGRWTGSEKTECGLHL